MTRGRCGRLLFVFAFFVRRDVLYKNEVFDLLGAEH